MGLAEGCVLGVRQLSAALSVSEYALLLTGKEFNSVDEAASLLCAYPLSELAQLYKLLQAELSLPSGLAWTDRVSAMCPETCRKYGVFALPAILFISFLTFPAVSSLAFR